MKLNKILMFMFVLLGLSVGVNAVLNDSERYYSFDASNTSGTSMFDISGNVNNGTCVNMASNCNTVSGHLIDATNFDGTDDYINLNTISIAAGTDKTIQFWANPDGNADHFIMDSITGRLILSLHHSAHGNNVGFYDGSFKSFGVNDTPNIWQMYTFKFTGTNAELLINGVSQANITYVQTALGGLTSLGSNNDGTGAYYDGQIDEFSIYSRGLTFSEIQDSYNSGLGKNPYAILPSSTLTYNNITLNFETAVNNSFFNSSRLDFATFITNTSTNDNVTNNWNLFTPSSNFSDLNNFYGVGLNASDFLPVLLDDTYTIWFNASNDETNVTSDNFTFTIDTVGPTISNNVPSEINNYNFNDSFFSCSDDNLLSCNISINGLNKASGINFSLINNGNLSYNITAIDLAGNQIIEAGVLLVNPFAYFNFQDSLNVSLTSFTLGGRTDVNGIVNYTTYNDGLVIGSNTLVFEKVGYISQTITFNLTDTTPIFNQTYTVSESEIIVTILNRETGTIVSGPEFQLEFIAEVGLITNTTTGTKTITNTLFQAGSYQLVSSGSNYTTEQLFFEFTNQESLALTIYTTDTTDLARGVVEIKVVDKFGKSIVGAIAQALQWDSTTSSYIKVSEGLTAEDGKTLLNIILDTKQYIFQSSFESLSKNTTPQFIPELLNGKEIVIPLDLGPTEFEGFLENINYNINENLSNFVSNITLEWETTDGTSIEGCIIYYRVQPSGVKTELSNDCSTGSDNILMVSKQLNSSYYIEAQVGFVTTGGFYPQETFLYQPVFDISTVLKDTNLALFILPELYLIVVLVGMANVFIGALLLILVNGLGLWLVPQFITPPVVAFFYFVGLALMIGGSKRK